MVKFGEHADANTRSYLKKERATKTSDKGVYAPESADALAFQGARAASLAASVANRPERRKQLCDESQAALRRVEGRFATLKEVWASGGHKNSGHSVPEHLSRTRYEGAYGIAQHVRA